jgi:hypothetical protein
MLNLTNVLDYTMAKEFCHICNDGGKKCFKINDTLEYAMLKMAPKCPLLQQIID